MSRLQGSQSTQRTLVNAYLVHVFLCKFMVASGPLLTLSDSNKSREKELNEVKHIFLSQSFILFFKIVMKYT